jgi:hypothetical protein
LQPNPLLDNGMLKSPFESHASGQQHPPAHASPKYTKQPSNADTDAAAIAAAEAGDDLQALPDASRSAASAASLRATGPPAANGSFKSNPSSSNSSSGGGGGGAGGGGGSRRATRKLIPLNKVCSHVGMMLCSVQQLANACPATRQIAFDWQSPSSSLV